MDLFQLIRYRRCVSTQWSQTLELTQSTPQRRMHVNKSLSICCYRQDNQQHPPTSLPAQSHTVDVKDKFSDPMSKSRLPAHRWLDRPGRRWELEVALLLVSVVETKFAITPYILHLSLESPAKKKPWDLRFLKCFSKNRCCYVWNKCFVNGEQNVLERGKLTLSNS